MSVKKTSRKGKGKFAVYKAENRVAKNRAAKLARHLKNNPNDTVAAKAAKAKRGNLRKTPTGTHKPAPAKVKLRDASGKILPWPLFVPTDKAGNPVNWPYSLYEYHTKQVKSEPENKQPRSKK